MAETFGERVNAYIGTTYSDNDLLGDYLTEGARHIISLIRDDVLMPFVVPATLTTSGIAYKDRRILRAYKDGYLSQEVDGIFRVRIKDEDSIFYATPESPRHYTEGGKLYIEPGGGYVDAIVYPTLLYSGNDVSVLPKDLHDAIVIHAAIRVLIQLANSAITDLKAITFASLLTEEITIPTAPVLTAVVYNDNGLPTLTTVEITDIGAGPAYTKIDEVLSFTNANTYINTNEDIELGQAELNKVKVQMENWTTKVQEELNTFNKDLVTFNAEIQRNIEQARIEQETNLLEYRTKVENGQLAANKDMEAIYQNNVLALQKYDADVRKYVEIMNNVVMQLQSKIQQAIAVIQAYGDKVENLRKLSEELLSKYI